MKFGFSLSRRIVIAFTIQTLLFAVVAYSIMNFYVDYVKETVLYDHLVHYMDAYMSQGQQGGELAVPTDIKIYIGAQQAVPEFARNLGPGLHEILLDDGSAYHVIAKQYNNQLVYLVHDQTVFEHWEKNINHVTLFVLFLFVLVSFVFSRSLADRVVQPIINLSEKMSALTVDNFTNIKPDYVDDEIGALVNIIYDHIYTLNLYLQREKWITGDISHELRTPMMVISSSVDLLKQNSTSKQQREQLYQRIENAVASVNELVNTFLLLARGKGDDQPEPAICDIAGISRDVMHSLESLKGDKDVTLRLQAEGPVQVPVNENLFSIVLTNLLRNAIFNTEQGEIVVTINQDGFQVMDTGKGLAKVIKQFINNDEHLELRRNNVHLGLGLSIVKRVCEREKWSIHAGDGDRGGACFMIGFNNSQG